ncbi:PDZ domain-containing protein [Maribacter sp. HTCC2170]|uniref:PDZ domain-containing protein n=1 Tax=Maribacter sp. (strain HTCC2170 / KCCM 42371) TaxID=313603 RepID=UPI00006BD28D|nr:PDZ domain-containing protein [Maribacter sp. HTCC2170]EAR02044.1 hypothetical protein FB2170_02135 [Maribacter sp. HTCC2170]
MKNLSFILVLFFVTLVGCSPQINDIYIAPSGVNTSQANKNPVFNSIKEGIDKVNLLREEGYDDLITLHLLAGDHRLFSPIVISANLGPLKIIGAGSDKTSVKGSEKIDIVWEKHDDEIWVANVTKDVGFDQLFVDGKMQILARYPNYSELGGHWQGHAADAISKERVNTWANPKGAIVHAMHRGEWGGFHFEVSGVDEDGGLILKGGHQNNRPSEMHATYRMVENVFEELDTAGEWYLDKESSRLYYWPIAGTDLKKAEFEVVRQKHLFEIVGSEENPVENVVIEGIRFEHAQRTVMEKYEPLLRSDWMMYRGAAVFIEGTENVSINDCEFTELGGNAIFVSNYNRGTIISNNHIHQIGASAVSFVGSPNAVRSPSFQYGQYVELSEMDTIVGPKTNSYPSNSLVDNNLIHRIGRVEKQTAGVQIAMAMKITISNNSIYDVPRAGINIGDGTWGGHIIDYNDVFNTVLESGDHGAFNSWGRDRFWHPNRNELDKLVIDNPEMPKWDAIHTTIIRNNRFRCDHGWDIDLDDGSSNYHIYNNVCLNGGLKFREGFNRIAENNILVNNGFHPHVWFKESKDVFMRNIVFTEHKDIRLQGWGKEVDYNFFPDKATLLKTQEKGVDVHSIYGDPLFIDSKIGNYSLVNDSPAIEVGFNSFSTDVYGVKNESLKMLAKSPEIPKIFFGVSSDSSAEYKWLGSVLKNIETMAERSASGLDNTAGVLILSIEENSTIARSELKVNDVIISSEEDEITTVEDLMKSFQNNNWKGKLNLQVIRNQKEISVILITK